MKFAHNARIEMGEPGIIHAFVSAEVLYDIDKLQEVQRGVVGIYHPRCCSGLNILYQLAEESLGDD
jgi:hypothetical protein